MAKESNQNEVETAISGIPIKLRGPLAFMAVFIVLLMGGMAWLVYYSLKNWGTPIDLNQTFIQHTQIMTNQHDRFRQTVDELTYVMTLTPEERQQLKLSMPPSLREKVRRGE